MSDEMTCPVLLHGDPDHVRLTALAESALGASRSVPGDAVTLAVTWSPGLPLPGLGQTLELWESLATLGAVDLAVARTVEPHLDARAILAEAGRQAEHDTGTWGVYAAEGPGVRVRATLTDTGWTLDGVKPWCSLAGHLSHALVTAWVDDENRGLFAVALDRPGVEVGEATWVARGLATITSGPVTFTGAVSDPVGAPGWYLTRDGFAYGGLGVAAIWYGGAVGVARRLHRQAGRRTPDQVGLLHLGAVDAALAGARAVLVEAAARVDRGEARGADGAVLALRVRQVVADAAETVLTHTDHALGPGPLATEEEHARRVDDLRLYLRQHHAERDQAALGGRLAAEETPPW